MDEHGYPTKEEIEKIQLLAKDHRKAKELIEFLQKIWKYPEYIKWDGSKLELNTGGWSGHEDIIYELNNSMFWFLYWQKSERGGHYCFEVKGLEFSQLPTPQANGLRCKSQAAGLVSESGEA